MSSQTTAPSDSQAFLSKTLPKHATGHILAVGEHHDQTEHMEWMRSTLPTLQHEHHLTAIGLEDSAYLNVALWALQDGVLQKELGSQAAAEAYIHHIFRANTRREFQENAHETAALAIAAIHQGVGVVAYDTRHPFASEMQRTQSRRKQFTRYLREEQNTNHPDAVRASPELLEHCSSEKHWRNAWVIGEIDWLTSLRPEYAARLAAMDALIAAGNEKGLGVDPINACMFNTLAPAEGNRILVCGIKHLDGIGDKSREIEGVFGQHVFQMGNPHRDHKLTHAVIACTATMEEYNHEPEARTFPILNIESGALIHAKEAPLAPKSLADPMLIYEIKTAADAVQAAMNGSEQGHTR